ncbi:YkgJ family cysteine cluster protein [Oscillatoria sp. CS-180]|uniref:YkgJ family cysteine cluster protein n=1 Tax=Oscillatoria sp. CS-180 TaxID=3021720 RepID=UPI0023302180|nr:YkgJ family cysteine cluster protein [Oscillatoria sp. CS-180]MDB9524967.1 YkgJ family cysteine cluster protein [Oscillatoria sp. CS-180]
MANWTCIQGCGACCQLDPRDRPDLDQYLTATELEQYLSLVGEDGWCIHYDANTRRCTIYETRPAFCRVQADTFGRMFDITPDELDEFEIDCCEQQIEGVYGNQSDELKRFIATIGD